LVCNGRTAGRHPVTHARLANGAETGRSLASVTSADRSAKTGLRTTLFGGGGEGLSLSVVD
jgi:hypothetical protein